MLKFGLFVAALAWAIGLFGSAVPLMEEAFVKTSKAPAIVDSTLTNLDIEIVHETQPRVRVGLLESYGRVDFRVSGPFTITNLDGDSVFSHIKTQRRWRCKVETSKPARFVYSVLLGTFNDEENAEALAESLRARGHAARLLPYGRKMQISHEVIHEGLRWRVIVGAFDSEEEAHPLLDYFVNENSNSPRILRHRTEDPAGTVELYDSEYDRSAMLDGGFRIIPDKLTSEVTIYDIRVGVGFHWEHKEDRAYRGVIEIRLDSSGNLLALNELLLDDYLKGVVPSEMHPTYPLEALKAQAVAARSYTIAKLADSPANDPIDFPATVAFQVYSGVTKEDSTTTKAVVGTAGEVLKVEDKVCEAYFSANSGGHTESKEFWSPPGESYLVGRPVMSQEDLSRYTLDLTGEKDVETWVRSHPDNYSNPRGTNIEMLDRNARYFRWEVTYTRQELEQIIKRKLGFSIGTLIEIQPLLRGKSGRIIELELLGSHRNHKIFGELNIRRVLSDNTLNSSCFIIQPVMGNMGNLLEITLIGAGFGHGVGMDQTAAGVMANNGYSYKDILALFYADTTIEKIW